MFTTPDGTFRLPRPTSAARHIKMGVQKHFTGSLVIGDEEGEVMQFESHTEKQVALVMLARRDVAGLENQVPFAWTDQAGSKRTHFFDFRVTYQDGSRAFLIVKNSRKAAKVDFVMEARLLASQVTAESANKVLLVTEKHLDPVEVFNAELIHSVRLPDPEADAAVLRAVNGVLGAVKVGNIVSVSGYSGRGFLAVVRLLRKHCLEMVAHERIDYDTLVRRRPV